MKPSACQRAVPIAAGEMRMTETSCPTASLRTGPAATWYKSGPAGAGEGNRAGVVGLHLIFSVEWDQEQHWGYLQRPPRSSSAHVRGICLLCWDKRASYKKEEMPSQSVSWTASPSGEGPARVLPVPEGGKQPQSLREALTCTVLCGQAGKRAQVSVGILDRFV